MTSARDFFAGWLQTMRTRWGPYREMIECDALLHEPSVGKAYVMVRDGLLPKAVELAELCEEAEKLPARALPEEIRLFVGEALGLLGADGLVTVNPDFYERPEATVHIREFLRDLLEGVMRVSFLSRPRHPPTSRPPAAEGSD